MRDLFNRLGLSVDPAFTAPETPQRVTRYVLVRETGVVFPTTCPDLAGGVYYDTEREALGQSLVAIEQRVVRLGYTRERNQRRLRELNGTSDPFVLGQRVAVLPQESVPETHRGKEGVVTGVDANCTPPEVRVQFSTHPGDCRWFTWEQVGTLATPVR